MSQEINIDQNTCIGCTTCAAMCPRYYEMDDTGKAQSVIKKVTDEADFECVTDAENACPVDAISVSKNEK